MLRKDDIKNPKVERTITKQRLIVGLLGEIDAAGVLLILAERGSTNFLAARIASDFRVPFEESTLSVKDIKLDPGIYTASALFAGQRLTFDLEIFNAQGDCVLPKEIRIADLRKLKRRKFGPEVEYAEIFTSNSVLMATPIDMSQNSIALILNSTEGNLKQGEDVKLLIRGDTLARDIFSANLQVKEFVAISGRSKVLLGPKNPEDDVSGSGLFRAIQRHSIGRIGFILRPGDDNLGEPLHCAVTNVSLTGFQCIVPTSEGVAWVMPGTHVLLSDMDLTATVVWSDGPKVGLRIDALDDSESLSAWTEVLRNFKIESGFHHTQVDELVNLFTESGLLKGKRRKIYGENAAGYLPPGRMAENPLLYHRITAVQQNSRIEGHISMARLCDDLWYFQEGAHSGEGSETYRELYIETISTARALHLASKQAPRFLAGLFHADIKSAGAFGAELFSDPSSRVYRLLQLSMAANTAGLELHSDIELISLERLDADGRRESVSNLDATLVEVFSGWNGTHPRLNAELAKLGSHHEAKSLLVGSSGRVWGLAFRLRSYYALNVTGVMNSLFFVSAPDVSTLSIQMALRALIDNGFAFGTDDVALIASAELGSELTFEADLMGAKPFTFFIVDNLLNREFLGAKVEDGEGNELRTKASHA